ncbi:unnamed protein product [Rotaria socialis]|uniref:Uncharacterized protein n=1 Tax=Rotaria socialis TaxID=392032 RepID=A0A821E0P1_9BILA|nr:unnamed protein product [Rotaria socialis]
MVWGNMCKQKNFNTRNTDECLSARLDQFVPVDCQPFRIKKDVALRAIDPISCSMRQYAMLLDATNARKFSSIGRKLIVAAPDHQQGLTNSSSSTQHNELKQNKLSTNIFDRESVIEKHTYGKTSITATHIIHQLDEFSSGISSQNREDSMNNGFLSPIAWKTQSHSKESKDLNLSSTSLARPTRAHLKCINKNKDRSRKPKKIHN